MASRVTRQRGASAPTPGVVRLVEASGTSARGFEAAVSAAVRSAAGDVPKPIGVEVSRMWADLEGGTKPLRYHASVKIAYRQRLVAPKAPKAPKARGARKASR